MAAMFGRQKPTTDFVPVRPGESGTTGDAFSSFTYLIPSDDLRRRLERRAEGLGRRGQPDPTAVVIPELDEIKEFRDITRQAAFSCTQAAVDLFTRDRAEIMNLVNALLAGPEKGDPDPASTQQVRRGRVQVLSGNIVNLEKALDRRLDTLGGHFDALRRNFMTGVYKTHRLERQLHERGWEIDGFHISEDMRDFGQSDARAAIAKIT